MKSRYVLGVGGGVCVPVCVSVHGWAHCSILWRLAGWGYDWQTTATETTAGAPLSHPVIVSPMKGSLITPAQRGLPSSPIPEIHYSPPFPLPPQPPFPSLLHLLSLPYPSLPFFHIHPALCRATFNQGVGGLQRFSLSLSHKRTHTQCVCVCTLNLPKQFFQCNWAWGTCVHEIAQPLLHASCSGVYVPLLALQSRQLPNHILTGVFERLLSTKERKGKREREWLWEERKSGAI